MVKTTIYLPEELKRRLAALARRRHISEAELIRTSLADTVAEPARRPAFPVLASRGGTGTSNDSERVDELLAEGFGQD